VTVRAYLDHAGIGPLREAVRQPMRAALDEVLAHGVAEIRRLFPAREAARTTAARLLRCDPDEIALLPNTSTGLHLVADGIEWRSGDEIVVFDRDFPANVQPWRRLEARGVRLRWVPIRGGGYDLGDIEAALGPATRLIAVSHVNFLTGFRLDLDAVCALAQRVGALVCVDAVQSLGVLPLSLARTPVDFLAAGGHKWLGAPAGTGLFFCRRGRLDLLRWAPSGWFGYDGSQDMLVKGAGHFSYDLPPRPAARRFEGGMPDLLGLVGLAAALEEVERVGVEAIRDRVRELTDRLRTGLAEAGYPVLSPAADDARSGIVTFTDPDGDNEGVHRSLVDRGCHVSFPDGKLRSSPHYWTTDEEMDIFLEELERCRAKGDLTGNG
jgi:cysteine desulfurase / selenocysteine lyase